MKFHANRVSASADGDYCQVMFEAIADANDPGSPYVLVQRQFEDPDGGRRYVETRDEKYIGHFRVRRIEFSPSRFLLEIDRKKDNVVEVTFRIKAAEFKRVARVVYIISGSIEAP